MKRMLNCISLCAVLALFSACFSSDDQQQSSSARQIYRSSKFVQSFKNVESLRVTRYSREDNKRITQIVTRDGKMIVWFEQMQDDGRLAVTDSYLLVESLLFHIKSTGEMLPVREPQIIQNMKLLAFISLNLSAFMDGQQVTVWPDVPAGEKQLRVSYHQNRGELVRYDAVFYFDQNGDVIRIKHLNRKPDLEERYSDFRDYPQGVRIPSNAVSVFGESQKNYMLECVTVNPTELRESDFRPPTIPQYWLDDLRKRFK